MWVLEIYIIEKEHAMKWLCDCDDLLQDQRLDVVLVLRRKMYAYVDYS